MPSEESFAPTATDSPPSISRPTATCRTARPWGGAGSAYPDGICLDRGCFACMLGRADERTLS